MQLFVTGWEQQAIEGVSKADRLAIIVVEPLMSITAILAADGDPHKPRYDVGNWPIT